MTGEIQVLAPGGRVPLGAALLKSRRSGATAVVIAPRPAVVIPPVVGDVLGVRSSDIAGIAPTLRAAGRPAPPLDPGRDAREGADSWLAVRVDALGGLRIDPHLDDAPILVRSVVAHLRRQGKRVVHDAGWTVGATSRGSNADWRCPSTGEGGRTAETPGCSILTVTACLSDSVAAVADSSLVDLLETITAIAPGHRLTVALTDGFRSDDGARRLRARGIEVVSAPCDWSKWSKSRWGEFSHVIYTPPAMQSCVPAALEAHQPQATRVLFLPSLPFRDLVSVKKATPRDELEGLEAVRVAVEAHLASSVRQAEAVLCANEVDASFLRGLQPSLRVDHIPWRIDARVVPRAGRSGIVLLAERGEDVLAADEDAALVALERYVAPLRHRVPDLPVVIVATRPSAGLEAAAHRMRATFRPGWTAEAAFSGALAAVVAHPWGTGGPAAIKLALHTGTPFVATRAAACGMDLGHIAATAVIDDPLDAVTKVRQLLHSESHWATCQAAGGSLVESHYGVSGHRAAVGQALLGLGVATAPSYSEIMPGLSQFASRESPRQRLHTWLAKTPSLRPPGAATPASATGPASGSEDERYAAWCRRFGPTQEVLAVLAEELGRLEYSPLISVLMPVYNTEGFLLQEAIDSVRAQIYPNWQLCIADDGSTRPDTVAVLRAAAEDPSISVRHLPGQSGISQATNAALGAATGDFVTFLDHDDLLKPHALAQIARWIDAEPELDVVYSDEDKLDGAGRLFSPHVKPDWSPDELMSHNYVCHLTVIRRELVDKVGGLRSAYDGSQDWDLLLRVTEHTDRVGHIPEPLYTWRAITGSASATVDAKPYALDAGKRALADSLGRRGRPGTVLDTLHPGISRVRYDLPGEPHVAIVIPTKNGMGLLQRCIGSVIERSTYDNYELVVIDNQSDDGDTLAYLGEIPGRVLRYPHRFNYARMMNLAARSVSCDALLFLNNDTEVISPEWIEALLEHAMRPEVGAVGARLYFADKRPQHEGIFVGVGGWANNIDFRGSWARGDMVRNTSAVTGACTMVRPSVYWRVGGNDERLRVAYNDVDLCLRIRQAGYEVVYTPYAELYHYESSTRSGYEHEGDGPLFGIRWQPRSRVDPYYSPMFERDRPLVLRR